MQQALQTNPIVPATKKQPHSIMLPPECFTIRKVLCKWWAVPGFFQTLCLQLRFIRPKNLVSHSLRVLCVAFFLQNLQENSSRKSPVYSRLIPLRIVETSCSCQPLEQQYFFVVLFISQHNPVSALQAVLWYAFSALDLMKTGVCQTLSTLIRNVSLAPTQYIRMMY